MKLLSILLAVLIPASVMAQSEGGAGLPVGSTGGKTNTNDYRTPEQERLRNVDTTVHKDPRLSKTSPDNTSQTGTTPAGGNPDTLERSELH